MKKSLFILPIILCILVSCQDKKAKEELDQFKTQHALEIRNKDLIKQYYDDLDKSRVDELDKFIEKYISPDFVLHFPGGVDINGIEELTEYYASSMKAFSDGTHTIDEIITNGNKLAFRAAANTTHTGTFMGIQPTGQSIKITFAGFWSIKDGKIVEWWSEYDALSMMMQLGMELQMKDPTE